LFFDYRNLAIYLLIFLVVAACRSARINVIINNNISGEICELYVWPKEDYWGKFLLNRLYEPIPSRESLSITNLEPGVYNIQAIPCDTASFDTFSFNEVEANETITIELNE
jgi:hypothetical protein